MEKEKFINRQDEVSLFYNDLRIKDSDNKVRIIRAPSGIGKSELCKNILKGLTDILAAKVQLTQHESQVRSDWFYLRRCALSFDESAPANLKINKFLHSWGNKTSRKLFIDELVSILAEKFKSTKVEILYNQYFGGEYIDTYELFNLSGAPQVRLLQDYLKWLPSQTRVCLNIENIQNIDQASLDFIANKFIKEPKNIYLLLEYTDDDPEGQPLDHLIGIFNRGKCDLKISSLQPLKVGEAMKLLNNVPGAFEAFIENAYSKIGGNLRRLVDLDVNFALNPDDATARFAHNCLEMLQKSTCENISYLPSDTDRFILMVVYAHGGKAPLDLIELIREFKVKDLGIRSRRTISNSLKNLKEHHLVIQEEHEPIIRIAQDTIGNSIAETEQYHRLLLLAYDFLKKIYENPGETKSDFFVSRDDQLVILLRCYIELKEETRALTIFDELTNIALRKTQSKSLFNYLSRIVKTVKESRSENAIREVNRRVVKLYYLMGYMDNAFTLHKNTPNYGVEYYINMASLLDLTLQHQECINYVDNILNSHILLTDNYKLRLTLLKLAATRSMNRHKEADELYSHLIENYNNDNIFEYGFLLRNIELVQASDEDIVSGHQASICHFKKFGAKLDEARSCIAITLHLTRTHQLEEAFNYLNRAEQLLKDIPSEKHSLYNNMAGLNIYLGDFGEQTKAWIDIAEMSATASFDRFIIVMNRMIIEAFNGGTSNAEDDAYEIKELLTACTPSDQEIRKIGYFNLSLLYQYYGNRHAASRYLQQARKITNGYRDEMWKVALYDDSYINYIYRWKPPVYFEPTFLSYWTLDLI